MFVVRLNGEITPIVVGSRHELANSTVTLSISASTLAGGVAQLFFQFINGATYTIDVRYSQAVGGQFFDTSLGAPIPFMMTTTGLCGNMDGNQTNDFVSPNGILIETADEFGESCKTGLLLSCRLNPIESFCSRENNFKRFKYRCLYLVLVRIKFSCGRCYDF